eukprot:421608-Alexandrium_andersonii.AAC.1
MERVASRPAALGAQQAPFGWRGQLSMKRMHGRRAGKPCLAKLAPSGERTKRVYRRTFAARRRQSCGACYATATPA